MSASGAPLPLQDQVVLVTGSAHRVGKAIALAAAAAGARVAVHYHRAEAAAQATLDELHAWGIDAAAFQADQADPAQIDALFAAVIQRFGRLDVLVNSASAFLPGEFLDLDIADWQRGLAVNLSGPLLCCQAAARRMLAQDPPGGAIVNILDTIGRRPWPRFTAHSVAKAGLLHLSTGLARSLAPHIRVNAVVPGPVLKPDAMPAARWDALGARLPLARAGQAGDVGRAVVYLAAERFLTGVVLSVDGGDGLLGSSDE